MGLLLEIHKDMNQFMHVIIRPFHCSLWFLSHRLGFILSNIGTNLTNFRLFSAFYKIAVRVKILIMHHINRVSYPVPFRCLVQHAVAQLCVLHKGVSAKLAPIYQAWSMLRL